jgi:hypothetical protein
MQKAVVRGEMLTVVRAALGKRAAVVVVKGEMLTVARAALGKRAAVVKGEMLTVARAALGTGEALERRAVVAYVPLARLRGGYKIATIKNMNMNRFSALEKV